MVTWGAVAALLPGPPAHAAATAAPVASPGTGRATKALPAESGTTPPYAFADEDQQVEAGVSTADAALLEAGRSYRSTLPPNGTVHYRLELDATSTTYVSATAVPSTDSTASALDGVKVTLKDGEGRSCDTNTATFGAGRSPHPVAAWAEREISPRRSVCKDAGTYYVTVERADPDGNEASPDPWELELAVVSEPEPKNDGATSPPEAWNSATPAPVEGKAVRRTGGAGFAQATALGEGVWRDDIRPGRTLFYRVPVDWGRQLHVTAELGRTKSGAKGYVAAALDLDLYNPVRGYVTDLGIGYNGSQKSERLAPLPPVAYGNRHAPGSRVDGMRFAGSYYLVAHLAADVADDFGDEPVPLTLRVRLSGTPQDGPGYQAASMPPGIFAVTDEDREAAGGTVTGDDDPAMTALAVGGIGTGSALLIGLGVWTVVARRRGAA
ncbi:hypothetical protein N4P33_10670 [Streptomyces sp. 15-116A]|uniref:hypothetical protein n=1 Tax=Streptomyces sp. 15-116A TaxID=2259035 RepID=UPI0021B214AB|nr:hypothetical protein [Streptomyces sp. 15-116A]MCT7352633.1 hypothetical protein [Streptomyces sp. 15-116A]